MLDVIGRFRTGVRQFSMLGIGRKVSPNNDFQSGHLFNRAGSLIHQQSPDQMSSSASFDSLRRELITVESHCVLVFGVFAPADLKGASNYALNLA